MTPAEIAPKKVDLAERLLVSADYLGCTYEDIANELREAAGVIAALKVELEAQVVRLTHPILGINNRTPQEVFEIMSDRIRLALRAQAAQSDQ